MSDRYRIDSHKMALHPARTAAWLEGRDDWEKAREIFPIYVEISPVGYCNHQCTFCGVDYMLDRTDRPQIPSDLMQKTLGDMRSHGVRSVMFAGAGEPLLYRPLAECLRFAEQIDLDTSITTNGVALTGKLAESVLGLQTLRWIKVSINAGTAERYAQVHRTRPQDFERVIANLTSAVQIRDRLGGKCTIGGQMVALPAGDVADPSRPGATVRVPSNVDTAVELARRLREAGLDYVVIKPYSQHLMSTETRTYEGTTYDETEAWFRELESYSTDTFKVIVRRQTMAQLAAPERGYKRCQATPYHWAYLEADGNVWGCSAYLGRVEGDRQLGDDRFRYGNIFEQSFPEIWRGERRRANWVHVREELDITECRVNCRMHQVNLYLDEVANPGPHVHFI